MPIKRIDIDLQELDKDWINADTARKISNENEEFYKFISSIMKGIKHCALRGMKSFCVLCMGCSSDIIYKRAVELLASNGYLITGSACEGYSLTIKW